MLLQADGRKLRYVLVHVGPDDGEPGGSHERAHHRVGPGELSELARRLKSGSRLRVTCLAFGYKQGLPAEADWVVDTRFLANPYWEPVRDYVLGQPAAGETLERLEALLAPLLPLYREQGRQHLTIAFGCTGGRHRSVVLAAELAERLRAQGEVDVDLTLRELD